MVSLIEAGWTLTYADDMNVGEEATLERTVTTSATGDNNENGINGEITQAATL